MRVQQYQIFISFGDQWVPVTVANEARGDFTPRDQGECRQSSEAGKD